MEVGTIHGCYNAEYDKSSIEMKSARFLKRTDAQSGRDSNIVQDCVGAAFLKKSSSVFNLVFVAFVE